MYPNEFLRATFKKNHDTIQKRHHGQSGFPAERSLENYGRFSFGKISVLTKEEWQKRVIAGDVLNENGTPLSSGAPYTPYQKLYYYRYLPNERPNPFQETVLYQDDCWSSPTNLIFCLSSHPGNMSVKPFLCGSGKNWVSIH